jgi:hypothetical protein
MWHQLFLAYFEDCEPFWLSYYFLFNIWLWWVQSQFFLVVKGGCNLLHCCRENVREEIVMPLMCVHWTYLCLLDKRTRGNEDYQKWFLWLTFYPHQCDLWEKLVFLFRFVMMYNFSTPVCCCVVSVRFVNCKIFSQDCFRASSGFVTEKFAVHGWL